MADDSGKQVITSLKLYDYMHPHSNKIRDLNEVDILISYTSEKGGGMTIPPWDNIQINPD